MYINTYVNKCFRDEYNFVVINTITSEKKKKHFIEGDKTRKDNKS